MLTDVRLAVRLLRSQPSFTSAVVLTLALGIGANTAVFSILDASLLKPLPFRDPHQLVDIIEVQGKGTAEERYVSGMTRARLEAWRAQTHIFSGIEADREPILVHLADDTATMRLAYVSPGLFPLLGVEPILGHGFVPDDGDDALLIGQGVWARMFGNDRSVIGRSIVLNSKTYIVVGVMPASARYPLGAPIDAWARLPDRADPKNGVSNVIGVVARLRPEWSLATVQPALDAAAAAIQATSPSPSPWGASLDPLDGRSVFRSSNAIVTIGFAAVGLVLLTACANVAMLLLGRGWSRQNELAIRHALGASRWRMARLLIMEGMLLSAAGGILGLVLAPWLIGAFPAVMPPRLIFFSAHDVTIDVRVIAFAIACSVVVAVISSLAPSLRGSRAAISGSGSMLSAHSRASLPPTRTRDLFIALQVALVVILLVGAGLLTSSLIRMTSSDPGYGLDGLVSIAIDDGVVSRTTTGRALLLDTLLQRTRSLSDVTSATFGVPPPKDGAGSIVAERSVGDPSKRGAAALLWCGPGYFRTLQITIVRGRPFEPHDDAADVAIVDEDAARYFWPGEAAIGQRVRYSPYVPWRTVIGVARNVRTSRAGSGRDVFELYMPATPQSGVNQSALIVRTTLPTSAIATAIMTALQTLGPKQRVTSASTLEALYGPSIAQSRFMALMMSLFAGLATVTAGLGLYGALAYAVATRVQEIGVRLALGATALNVLDLVTREVLRPVVLGLTLGLVVSQWGARSLASQLYHVAPSDPVTMIGVVLTLLGVATAAAAAPALRASRVDPAMVLRAQ